MLLYTSTGPDPKVVRMFVAERGITGIERKSPTSWAAKTAGPNTSPATRLANPGAATR